MKIAIYAILIYVALVAVVFVLQRRMLYLPSATRPSEEMVRQVGLAFWPTSEGDYRGFLSTEPEDESKGTVIVFHGNAGRAADRSYYARALTPRGYRVLLAEYPGYGGRSGRPSEAALIADAKETVRSAYEAYGGPIVLWGESLGSGVASAVAADPSMPISGLVLMTPWDSLPKLAQQIYWFFPARWLVLDQFDNVKNVQSYAGPVAVVMAERDEIIPTQHSMRTFEAALGEKKLWVLEGAGHNSWPIQPEALWWQEVIAFISEGSE